MPVNDFSKEPWWLLEQLWGQIGQIGGQGRIDPELRANIESVLAGE